MENPFVSSDGHVALPRFWGFGQLSPLCRALDCRVGTVTLRAHPAGAHVVFPLWRVVRSAVVVTPLWFGVHAREEEVSVY